MVLLSKLPIDRVLHLLWVLHLLYGHFMHVMACLAFSMLTDDAPLHHGDMTSTSSPCLCKDFLMFCVLQ